MRTIIIREVDNQDLNSEEYTEREVLIDKVATFNADLLHTSKGIDELSLLLNRISDINAKLTPIIIMQFWNDNTMVKSNPLNVDSFAFDIAHQWIKHNKIV